MVCEDCENLGNVPYLHFLKHQLCALFKDRPWVSLCQCESCIEVFVRFKKALCTEGDIVENEGFNEVEDCADDGYCKSTELDAATGSAATSSQVDTDDMISNAITVVKEELMDESDDHDGMQEITGSVSDQESIFVESSSDLMQMHLISHAESNSVVDVPTTSTSQRLKRKGRGIRRHKNHWRPVRKKSQSKPKALKQGAFMDYTSGPPRRVLSVDCGGGTPKCRPYYVHSEQRRRHIKTMFCDHCQTQFPTHTEFEDHDCCTLEDGNAPPRRTNTTKIVAVEQQHVQRTHNTRRSRVNKAADVEQALSSLLPDPIVGVDHSDTNYSNQYCIDDPLTQLDYCGAPAVGSSVVLTSDGECLFAATSRRENNNYSAAKQHCSQMNSRNNAESASAANNITSNCRRQKAKVSFRRGRSKTQDWVKVRTFNSAEEAEAFRREEKWAFGPTHVLSKGRKRYLRCPYATPSIARKDRCPCERYLFYLADSDQVEMHWNKQPHRHKVEPGLSGQWQAWQKLGLFADADAANAFVEKQGWSQHNVTNTRDGRKSYLHCPHEGAGLDGKLRCPSLRYLLYKAGTEEVELYWNCHEHSHKTTWPMKQATKEYVNQLFKSGIRKPHFVLEYIRRKGLPDASVNQIADYIKSLRREYNPVFGGQSANNSSNS